MKKKIITVAAALQLFQLMHCLKIAEGRYSLK